MKKEFTMMVAGFDYHQKELASLMTEENFEYTLSKKEMLEEYDLDEDTKYYQYAIAECILDIRHEPNNPYDPAALQAFADGVFIGYVPRGNLDVLRKISMLPGLRMTVKIFGGRYKCLEYDDEEDYYGEMLPKFYQLRSGTDPYKAIMVFEYDS